MPSCSGREPRHHRPHRDHGRRRHLACAVVAFPIAYYAARYAKGQWKALFYLGVMLPLWSSYLVKVYAWKLILAKEGIITWAAATHTSLAASTACCRSRSSAATRCRPQPIGTFLVFVYVWLPYMILPMQARWSGCRPLLEASADLGATRAQTFRTVILPLALPGIIAGSIFTFSLTLGDYIIPQIIGNSRQFIGRPSISCRAPPETSRWPPPSPWCRSSSCWSISGTLAKRMGAFDAL
jgi:putative spermidine/putrescine transport system permease protein